MVGHTMRKAFKKLEARKVRERKEGCSKVKSNGASVLDPSHELSQQRQNSVASSIESPYTHSLGLHSNPELHTSSSTWSSAASVYSFDSVSISECSVNLDAPATGRLDLDDDLDLDMMPYDFNMRQGPARRRSTGSSRQKSQQKLAKILGWNTSFPQWKAPKSSYSAENVSSAGSSARTPTSMTSPLGRSSPMTWEDQPGESSDTTEPSYDLRMRQFPARRSHSVKDHTTRTHSQPYDFQMRQFLHAKPYTDAASSARRYRGDADHGASSPRELTPHRRSSAVDVDKPLPSTPAVPAFPSANPPSSPMSTSTMASMSNGSSTTPTPTPTSASSDASLGTIPELSADEASHLLSQPDPSELPTEASFERVELPDPTTLLGGKVTRAKSPTHMRSSSANSAVHDFGPGTTLSIIEEEPFEVEELNRLKVYELPGADAMGLAATGAGGHGSSGGSCPGLSPSSSLSSRRLRAQDDEDEVQLEADASASESGTTATVASAKHDRLSMAETEAASDAGADGEEITIIMDEGSFSFRQLNQDMTGKSFLALDEEDDTSDDGSDTDTEETVRNRRSNLSYVAGDDSICQSDRSSLLSDRYHRRSTSAETSKTSWTATTEKTIVDPDYRHDLAKQMDWL